MKKVFKEIKNVEFQFDDHKFKSTLLGCKAIAWSKYHRDKNMKCLHFARKAIESNPNCHLWYFVLGKILRTERRSKKVYSGPSAEEIECFRKSYQMSRNLVYGIYAAQMYTENRDHFNARLMYERVLHDDPKSKTILLRLASGFTRLKKFELAKVCFDKIEKESQVDNMGDNMYLHYRGIYYFEKGSLWVGKLYFK